MAKQAVTLVLLALVSTVTCARILAVFPMPSVSHHLVFREITQEFINRGHEVVVITTDPAYPKGKAPKNLTEIDVHDTGYEAWVKAITKELAGNPTDVVTQLKALVKTVPTFFEAEMKTEAVKDIIEKKMGDFDLLITELCIRPSLGFSHIFKVPVIQMSSLGSVLYNDDVMGSASHPLLFPSNFHRRIYNLTMLEKIKTLWESYTFMSYYTSLEEEEHEMMKRVFGPDVPTLSELKKNIDITMLNIHPVWADNQPVPPSVVFLGGIHQKPTNSMPKELETHLNSSRNGVIYVSFGTNSMPSRFDAANVKTLLDVLSEVPYDVLLKWDQDHLPKEYKNIKISKWFPQSDVLSHPKVKLFITQGGLQSTDEAISSGVPLIGIPIMGDQYYNSEKYVRHGIGKMLYWNDFDAQTFRAAIDTVINDKSYRQNIIRLREIMRDSPQSPLERAVWWAEYVLRHGGAKHLRPPTAHITLYEYLEINLLISIISVILATFVVVTIIVLLMVKSNVNLEKKKLKGS
ncbi:UDP-glucosyltransferase 2-like isoform X1 [Aricia agestis]|uniref:UDP-glucosyltransferase 2-like isoform X1 n=1 Tax=Aricia agestis TaxID=91739 RepID=UPI001C209EF2|nr:UDP-glucosyltransferase 2-like isoform X1 [Aricia agestis]